MEPAVAVTEHDETRAGFHDRTADLYFAPPVNRFDRPFSLEELFRSEYSSLVRALTLACGNPEDAADAVQDAFVQAERHWRRISAYEQPAAWLRRTAVNRLANRRRGDRRREAFLARTVAGTAEQRPVDIDLRAAVESLPDGQRMAVGLHYLADLPVAQVAEAMGISPGTVKSQLYDARAALARRPEVASERPRPTARPEIAKVVPPAGTSTAPATGEPRHES